MSAAEIWPSGAPEGSAARAVTASRRTAAALAAALTAAARRPNAASWDEYWVARATLVVVLRPLVLGTAAVRPEARATSRADEKAEVLRALGAAARAVPLLLLLLVARANMVKEGEKSANWIGIRARCLSARVLEPSVKKNDWRRRRRPIRHRRWRARPTSPIFVRPPPLALSTPHKRMLPTRALTTVV